MTRKMKLFRGKVISNKMNKSIIVCIERLFRHSLYGKFIKKNTKLYVHDEKNLCMVGDIVDIYECKPISKTKSWCLFKIV